MGPMVPPQMAFLKRWPYRSRWGGAPLRILDELLFRRLRRKLDALTVLPVEPVRLVRRTAENPGD